MKSSLSPSPAPMDRIRGALVEQLRAAGEGLQAGVPSDGAIHAVRERLKRARAALRLLRACLRAGEYRRQNYRVRDAARPVAPLRDSRVLLNAILSLERGMLARALRREHALRRRELSPAKLRAAAASLREVLRRIESVPAARLARGDVGAALERSYRTARKAYRRALHHPTDARLHEWRKQTKYLLHQLELVAPRGSRRFLKRCRRARRLTRCLGEDHDLALLRTRLPDLVDHAARPGPRPPHPQVRRLGRVIERRRKALQKEARDLGRRLFAAKPARVRIRFEQQLPSAAAAARGTRASSPRSPRARPARSRRGARPPADRR